MEPVAETVMGFVMTLAAASYGHFGVTLKTTPRLQHAHVQRSQTVQRLPVAATSGASPCIETIAERPAPVTIRHA